MEAGEVWREDGDLAALAELVECSGEGGTKVVGGQDGVGRPLGVIEHLLRLLVIGYREIGKWEVPGRRLIDDPPSPVGVWTTRC